MRTDHQPVRSAYPNPSVPEDLVELYREHAAQLPPLSTACADGMRAALRAIGVEPPPPPPPTKTTAATAARTKQRPQGGPKGQWLRLTNETEQRCHCGNRARAAFVLRVSRGVQATRLVCLAHATQTARAAVATQQARGVAIADQNMLAGKERHGST